MKTRAFSQSPTKISQILKLRQKITYFNYGNIVGFFYTDVYGTGFAVIPPDDAIFAEIFCLHANLKI